MRKLSREGWKARERRRRLRARPLLHLVPNIFTILGLCAGFTGMRYALDQRYELAVALIAVAVMMDALDGRSARMLHITSRLGAQLDSLADFLSFGVAPAFLVYLWSLHEVRGVGWALAMLFATCSALRLARFNVELEDPEKPRWTLYFFTGVPAPAAAGLALLPMIASFVLGESWMRAWWLNAAMTLAVALLMVSRIPTFSLKRVRIKPEYVMPVLVVTMVVVVFLVTEPWATLSIVGALYLLSIPLSFLLARRMREGEATAPAERETQDSEEERARVVPIEPRGPRG